MLYQNPGCKASNGFFRHLFAHLKLTVVGKSIWVVNTFHVVPHISPGGGGLLADGAEEKSWCLIMVQINKLVKLVRVLKLVRVNKASACMV